MHTALAAPLILHHTRIYRCDALRKKSLSMAKCRRTFFGCHHSSLVKAAMNAAHAMVLTKRLNFFFFQWPKAEQRP
jgi:hypothetical protein